MGLPLSITNRIRCKGAPSSTRMLFSSRGFPEQGMGFLHRIPTFNKRIEFASIASPSPNENGFAPKGSTSPSEWDSHRDGHPLSPLRECYSLQEDSLNREWDSHRIPTFNKRIEFASIASPSPNENGFAPKGSTSPSEWDSHRDGHPLSPENHPLQTYGILVRRVIPSLANGFRF